jgi:uncharacterized tellurite resistance protein B-like protein
MFDRLMDFLNEVMDGGTEWSEEAIDLKLAVAAMLVEAANMDETFATSERSVVERLLVERFELSAGEARKLVEEAEARIKDSTQYHPFTRQINEQLDIAGRTKIVEMMWEVAYADGVLDPQEDMLLRQVAGLLHVPDKDRGLARKRALARLGLQIE